MRGVGGATTGTQVAGKERGLCGLRRSGDAKQRGQMGLPRAVSCGVRSVPFSAPLRERSSGAEAWREIWHNWAAPHSPLVGPQMAGRPHPRQQGRSLDAREW